ncbi:phosphotransferase [Pseudooceanicola pacificus]|uniref:phosphotransferase n=1 Tax=Pseudooceanicola pacificus TaxID=2676438 RepID=UPI002E268ED0
MTGQSQDSDFVTVTVLKRDAFSETVTGHLAGDPATRLALRKLDELPLWSRPIARFLARREVRALREVQGITGTPQLLRSDRQGILRSWSEGTPLQLARPATPAFYRDARRLLRELRHRGVTHNDIAKPQNWLMTPEGLAAVIDFQLASVHRRRGKLFRVMAREDLRHLLKQKRAFAPHLLTPSERRMLDRKALPARVWMATAKPLYNYVTRRLMNWSDGEGTGDRLEYDGPPIVAAIEGSGAVTGYFVTTYALPSQGVGVYVFAETALSQAELRALIPESNADLVQPVADLPRTPEGLARADLLALVATNRLDELEEALKREPDMRAPMAPIIAHRLNLTDRILRR